MHPTPTTPHQVALTGPAALFFLAKMVLGLGFLMQMLPKAGSITMGDLGKGACGVPFQMGCTGI